MTAVSTNDQAQAPLTNTARIRFLDALRGLALLGILLMNIMGAVQSNVFYRNMNLQQPVTGLNYYAWVIAMVTCEGAMRGLFSVLFGAGSLLLLDRIEKGNHAVAAADIYYRRVIWLMAFGVFDAFVLLWWGDILFFYGLIGMFLFPFRKMSVRWLLIPIVVLLVFGVYHQSNKIIEKKAIIEKGVQADVLQSKKVKLSATQATELTNYHTFRQENSSKGMMQKAMQETATMQQADAGGIIEARQTRAVYMESVFLYDNWFDVLLFFFVGMILYRSGFLSGESHVAIYVLTAVIGVTAGVWYNYINASYIYAVKFDEVIVIQHRPAADLLQVRRIFQVVGYIGLLALLYKLSAFRRVFNVLAPAGQLAFTNYLVQSVFMLLTAINFYGRLQRYEIFGLALGFYAFQVIFSHIWLRYFLFGPCEWLWRSLTYLKRPSFRKLKPAPQLSAIQAA
ncbi:DUF418 domain-containing protein [Chitinophaga agrisoli]|nr:DUF418 domain-containing protein [Chitinophaga agrisoli]